MNILHVLSQHEVTGAETYAAALAGEQLRKGHRVWIVSDTFHTRTGAEVFSLPIGKRDVPQRIRNIAALKRIIGNCRIDVLHAHSRAASWVSYFATRGGKVPLVSTVHGRQHVHFSSKAFAIYGEQILAVCESIRDHLVEELRIPAHSVSVVRNGIDLSSWTGSSAKSARQSPLLISLVGRLSGPKGELVTKIVEEVYPRVVQSVPGVELQIVGGMSETEGLRQRIESLRSRKEYVNMRYTGFVEDVHQVYAGSALVIGSGRVVMEALASGARVIAVGESNYVGPVTETSMRAGLETNFGDAGPRVAFDAGRMSNDIVASLKGAIPYSVEWGKDIVREEFGIEEVTSRVVAFYVGAIGRKMGISEIPVLMYHRVTDGKPAGTKHGIYVSRRRFDRQLSYLHRKGYTTLTFYQMKEIAEGKRPLPARPIILTFDDGYEDNYLNAFPPLKKYSSSAVIFLIANRAIRSNTWDTANGEPEAKLMDDVQIREMVGHGIEFGAHSVNHLKLTAIPLREARDEIRSAKVLLEERVGSRITSFAYPFGGLNDDIKRAVRLSGYDFGIATDSGSRNFWSDFFEIRRIPIFPRASMFSFWKKTSGWYHKYKHVA